MIRPATKNDLAIVADMGREFYSEGRIPGTIVPDVFIANWQKYIEAGFGRIFLAEEEGEVVGFLGGLLYPDPNDGDLVGSEMFWFVQSEHRGSCGMRLLSAFEKWAISTGAKRLVMGHLSTLAPEKLKKLYERLGYVPLETHYVKEINHVEMDK